MNFDKPTDQKLYGDPEEVEVDPVLGLRARIVDYGANDPDFTPTPTVLSSDDVQNIQ